MALMSERRFAPLFWCQFFAAFNDNVLKTSLVFLILFGSGNEALITLASAIFIAPFFFLSALGGELADRFDKALVARRLKLIEIPVAALAVAGYLTQSVPVLFVALAGFGILSALFGPLKYGILPDHLAPGRLPAANALIEGATFIAILTGTVAGGLAAGGGDAALFAILVMGFAIACWLASHLIPPTGEAAPALRLTANVARSTWATLKHLRTDRRLWWGALVTSWFWMAGIVVLAILPPLIKSGTGGDENTVTAFLAIFSIAVGAGSALAAVIARGRIVLTTTAIGALLLAVFAFDTGWSALGLAPAMAGQGLFDVLSSARGMRAAFDLAGLAFAGGLFIVPAFAAVQAWSDPAYRARTVAAVNVLNAAFMTGATVLVAVLQVVGVTVPQLFMALGGLGLIVALAIWRTMPAASS